MNLYKTMRLLSKQELIEKTRALLLDIKSMPYYENYIRNGHEIAVEGILNHNGLRPWLPVLPIPKTTIWNWLTSPFDASMMPSMTYLRQPCGSQESPDFIVKFEEGVLVGMECKSSRATTFPMYNSGGIKPNVLYIYCSQLTNETTIYMGGDILTKEQQALMDELEQKQKALEQEYNAKIKAVDTHHRGVAYYSRRMIIQEGGRTYTDYFTHPGKERCEGRVFQFINEQIDESYRDYFDSMV